MKLEEYDELVPKLVSMEAVSELAERDGVSASYNTLVSIYSTIVVHQTKSRQNAVRKKKDALLSRYRATPPNTPRRYPAPPCPSRDLAADLQLGSQGRARRLLRWRPRRGTRRACWPSC